MSTRGGKTIVMIDNVPHPRYVVPYTKEEAVKGLGAAFAAPYVPDLEAGESPELAQYSKKEVMDMKAATHAAKTGDLDYANFYYDRIVGKPKQITENLNVNISLADFARQNLRDVPPTGDELVIDIFAHELTDADVRPAPTLQKNVEEMTPDEIAELLGDV